MKKDEGPSMEEIHAFIDGELDPARAAEIAEMIAADSALAENVAAFRQDKERLRRTFGPIGEIPVPPKWLEAMAATRREASRPSPSRRTIMALAASILVIAGLGLAYRRLSVPDEEAIIEEAFAAREDRMPAERVYAAETFTSPEDGNRVVTAALALMLKAPDLTRLGYRLASIQTYAGVPGGKAVELSYSNERDQAFTLYLRHPSGPARVDLLQRDGIRICVWQDDVLGAVMLGEMSAAEMARLASLAYVGLTL